MSPTPLKGSARVIGALVVALLASQAAAAVSSDLIAPQKRQATVRLAEQLVRASNQVAAESLVNPFNPAGFDRPAADDTTRRREDEVIKDFDTPTPPPSDRHILESLSARIPSKGTLEHGGKRLLSVGPKRIEVGQVLVVSDGGKDYEFEVVAITSTTFTLRFRNEEITRPVYAGR